MEVRAHLIKQLRGDLIQLGFERLDIGQQLQRVPQGPGYYETMQLLRARQQEINDAYSATQNQIKAIQQSAQPTLF